jgi:hypothetical protein
MEIKQTNTERSATSDSGMGTRREEEGGDGGAL